MRWLAPVFAMSLLPCCLVWQRDHDTLKAQSAATEREVQEQRAQLAQLRADLGAARTRLETALRANAEATSDVVGEKSRLNVLVGRVDEVAHAVDDMKRDAAALRSEFDARVDDLKRQQDASGGKPLPAVTVPSDRGAHWAALQQAYAQRDWPLTRAYGREYVARYPEGEHADEVLYLMGDSHLREGRPAAAIGEFNRVLKLFPRSKVLDKTLYGMGDAYLALHDCANAKLAFQSCANRFPQAKAGVDARGKLALMDRPSSGLCAP